MRALSAALAAELASGRPVALCRVVATAGSAPRGPGAAMAVTADGRVLGSIAAGCVESAVAGRALEVLEGAEAGVDAFAYSDADALEVGLTCGGEVSVLVERLDPESRWGEVLAWASAESGARRPLVIASEVAPTNGNAVDRSPVAFGPGGEMGSSAADLVLSRAARDGLESLSTGLVADPDSGLTVFVHALVPAPVMIIAGAMDYAGQVAAVAHVAGFHVVVADPRPPFATTARHPQADEVEVAWPQDVVAERAAGLGPTDALCVLTHDDRIDVATILAGLASDVGYIGLLGSRRTQSDRRRRLEEAGVTPAQMARLRGPAGLDLGAQTPGESAVAIVAEALAVRSGRDGRPLGQAEGPIRPSGI